MKSLVFKLVIIALTFLNLISCEDFIDLAPLDKISINTYWKTSTDLNNYMLQFYPKFPAPQAGIVYEDVNSDNLITATISPIMNGERTLTTGNWTSEWKNIRDINIFFEFYNKCVDDFSAYKQYVGEAHFFRAWFYFDLLKKYGDLPWYSKVIEVDDEELLMRPRDSRTTIVDSILVDLDKAVLYLNYRKTVGNSKLNIETALAFKTRVALYEGSWQKYHANTAFGMSGVDPNKYFHECIEAAEELINGNYTVGIYNTGNPNKDYYRLFGFDNMSSINEVLFYRSYNANNGLANKTQYRAVGYPEGYGASWELISTYLNSNGQPYNYLEISKSLKGNEFLKKIANECDPRLKSSIWIPGDTMVTVKSIKRFLYPSIGDAGALLLCPSGFHIKKSSNPDSPAAGEQYNAQSETGYIYFRFGEVLLNYAEAKYELDKIVAYNQLNLLRKRAGMPNFSVNQQPMDPNHVDYGYTISDELYEIRRERRVELAFEGFRKDDYLRWRAHSLFQNKRLKGYPLNYNEFPKYSKPVDNNGLIDFDAKQMPNGYNFREGQDYLYSIPQSEITLNPNLNQNPGW